MADQVATPAVPRSDGDAGSRQSGVRDRKPVVGRGGEITAVFVTDWIERGPRPRHAIGMAQFSDGQRWPVFSFHVAAACQDAELKGYPVTPIIQADWRFGGSYLAGFQ